MGRNMCVCVCVRVCVFVCCVAAMMVNVQLSKLTFHHIKPKSRMRALERPDRITATPTLHSKTNVEQGWRWWQVHHGGLTAELQTWTEKCAVQLRPYPPAKLQPCTLLPAAAGKKTFGLQTRISRR
jgi:hypothetical protein